MCVFAGGAGGGAHDQRDVFWRLHALVRQRKRAFADLHPRHQRQHRHTPQAALPAPANTPGPGQLAPAARGRPAPHAGPADAVTTRRLPRTTRDASETPAVVFLRLLVCGCRAVKV